jgi:hypothetical protein
MTRAPGNVRVGASGTPRAGVASALVSHVAGGELDGDILLRTRGRNGRDRNLLLGYVRMKGQALPLGYETHPQM